jgi:protein-S-isoprenylcysteine O-methyltransferase Ste14
VGKGRFLGIPIAVAGAVLALWAWRTPGAAVALPRPVTRLSRRPATFGGILVLAGIALLLRSAVLALYSLGVAWAASSGAVVIEEPQLDSFLIRRKGGAGEV